MVFFFFQAEDGIRDYKVTGVQTCALPIYSTDMRWGARSGNVRFYDRLDRGRERSQPVERFGKISGMIETAENLARDYGISREAADADRKSTRLNSSHLVISYAVFCLKKKKKQHAT